MEKIVLFPKSNEDLNAIKKLASERSIGAYLLSGIDEEYLERKNWRRPQINGIRRKTLRWKKLLHS